MSELKKSSSFLKTTSNREILSIIEYYIQNEKIISFLNSDEVYQKLTTFLSYYTSGDKNDPIPDKKLIGKYPLTKWFKDIITQIASWLDISKTRSFHLIQDFVEFYPKRADNFIHTENIASLPNQNIKDKIDKYLTDFVEDIIKFYYEERLILIDIIMKLLDYSYTQIDNYYEELRKFCNELIQNKKLYSTLWKQFTSYSDKGIRGSFSNLEKNDEHTIQIFKEQEKILDCMNIICNSVENCDKEIFEEMLNYFSKTNFMCYSYTNYKGTLHEKFSEIIIALTEKLIDKSILFTLLNFQPQKLYEIYNDTSMYKNDSLPFNVSIDKLSPFFNNYLGNQNSYPIQMTIASMFKVIDKISSETQSSSLSSKLTQYNNLHVTIKEEETLSFFIKMIERYSLASNINNTLLYSYFNRSYKFIIKKWVNLIMCSYYEGNEEMYPVSLLELSSLVLDTPITRDEFFDYDREKQTPIFKIFINCLQNPKKQTVHFLNLCFALSVPKKRNEYNKMLFSTLCEKINNDVDPFFANVMQIWENLNANLCGKISDLYLNYDEQSQSSTNINREKLEYIRLFIRLYSYNYENEEVFILMQKDDEENQVITNEEEQRHYNLIVKLTCQSMEILTKDKELYQRNTELISEMYHLLINLFDKSEINLAKTLCDDVTKCNMLRDIIYNTLSNDHSVKEYVNTVLAMKLINSMFSFGNLLQFLQTERGRVFVNEVFFYIKEAITMFGKLTSFETIHEIKIIRVISLILNNLLSILITSSNHSPILIDTFGTSSVTPSSTCTFIIGLLNQFEIMEFLFNFLRVKVYIDPSQTSPKNRYNFINMFLDKLNKKTFDISVGSNGFILHLIKKMLREIMRCFASMLDIVLSYKISKETEMSNTLYTIDFVKKLNYIIFITKTLPIFISDSSNSFCAYDLNMMMLLFTYANFEEENNVFYDTATNEGNDYSLNLHIDSEVDINAFVFAKFKRDADVNVASLCYQILTKFTMLFNIAKDANNTSINLMNCLSIKKNSSSEIEGAVNMFDKIKAMIISQLNKSDNFVKNEILKFLSLCAITQINFLNAIIDDFSYQNLNAKTFWEIMRNCIDDVDEGEDDIDSKFLFGYVILFISKILNNEMVYKKSIRDLLCNSANIKFFTHLINENLHRFRISNELFEQIKKNCENTMTHVNQKNYFLEILTLNSQINSICFNLNVVKNLSFIFSKLIALTEIIHSKPKIDFFANKELSVFLKDHITYLIANYTAKIPSDFSLSFNEEIKSLYSSTSSSYAIQIKQKELSIQNDALNQLIILNSENNLFNYGYSFNIDLKELYINCVNNCEYFDLFFDSLPYAITYNFALSIFEAKTQAMYTASYLIGLLYTIGPFNYAMSSSFFTSLDTFSILKSNPLGIDFNVDINLYANSANSSYQHPKLAFSTLKEIFSDNINGAIAFITDNFAKKIVLDSHIFNTDVAMFQDKNKNSSFKSINKNNNEYNSYTHYILFNYNIANYVFDYLLFLLKQNPSANTMKMSPRDIIELCKIVTKEISFYLDKSDANDISNLILSMISLSYSMINYLILSRYDFETKDIEIINDMMIKLNMCYNRQAEYRAVITYIFSTYCSIDYFVKNNNLREENILFIHDDNLSGVNSLSGEGNIIKSILAKFNETTPQIEYQSFIMLLINMVNKYQSEAFDIIQQEKIFYYLKAKNNYRDIIDYVSDERTNAHFLWCWTLKFISTVIMVFGSMNKDDQLKYYSVYKNAIDHFRYNEERVFKMLSNCDYVDINRNHTEKSLAFVEEVDMLTEVVAAIFVFESGNEFNDNDNIDFFFRVAECLMSRTLMMFIPNIKISTLFKSYSSMEKKMQDITLDKQSAVSSTASTAAISNHLDSPLRLNAGHTYIPVNTSSSLSSSSHHDRVSPLSITNYSTLFTYRIEQILSRILFNTTSALKIAFETEKFSYRQYIYESFTETNIAQFDEQSKNILNSYAFASSLLESMIKNIKSYNQMQIKSLLFYNNVSTGISMGFFNLASRDISINDMFKMNNYSIIYLLCLCVEVNECIKYFNARLYTKYQFETQFRDAIMKSMQNLKTKIKERGEVCRDMKEYNDFMERVVEGVKSELCSE